MTVLSMVVPVYSEIGTIGELVKRVQNAGLPAGISKQIIIVDDCSTDGTRACLFCRDRNT